MKCTVKTKKRLMISLFSLLVVIIGILLFVCIQLTGPEEKTEVVTISTLEKIVNVSKLSTFTAVYNGIAEIKNEKKPEKTDYYVSYEARVKAGIDFDKITFDLDSEEKIIYVSVPEIYITDISVDIASLDFIFVNKKADTLTVSQEAFRACEEDVKNESEQQDAIYELAKKNAVNILTAILKPIIEQMDAQYKLVVN